MRKAYQLIGIHTRRYAPNVNPPAQQICTLRYSQCLGSPSAPMLPAQRRLPRFQPRDLSVARPHAPVLPIYQPDADKRHTQQPAEPPRIPAPRRASGRIQSHWVQQNWISSGPTVHIPAWPRWWVPRVKRAAEGASRRETESRLMRRGSRHVVWVRLRIR